EGEGREHPPRGHGQALHALRGSLPRDPAGDPVWRLGTVPAPALGSRPHRPRSEEHTSELQSRFDLVCRLLLEKKKEWNNHRRHYNDLLIEKYRCPRNSHVSI